MNISSELPAPLNTFVVDVPANQYYDFELEPGSTYPLAGVTYPVDYGNIPGYIAEDTHELDLFVGNQLDGEIGFVIVERGDNNPNEHKFYVGLTPKEVEKVINELEPVLVAHDKIPDINTLVAAIAVFKDNQ